LITTRLQLRDGEKKESESVSGQQGDKGGSARADRLTATYAVYRRPEEKAAEGKT
jgi:hypothetical protein